jgi:hypothetical protein
MLETLASSSLIIFPLCKESDDKDEIIKEEILYHPNRGKESEFLQNIEP